MGLMARVARNLVMAFAVLMSLIGGINEQECRQIGLEIVDVQMQGALISPSNGLSPLEILFALVTSMTYSIPGAPVLHAPACPVHAPVSPESLRPFRFARNIPRPPRTV